MKNEDFLSKKRDRETSVEKTNSDNEKNNKNNTESIIEKENKNEKYLKISNISAPKEIESK
jgi:hypothetical protein